MAWNEPGGKGQDPWGGRGKNDGPPDLDEALKKFQEKLGGIFGGGKGSQGGNGSGNFKGLFIGGFLIVIIAYFLIGIYQVDEQERAVVLQFGAFKEIKEPGLRWNAPLVTKVFVVNVTAERQYATRGLMLTVDESIVELPITVQYNVGDVRSYVLHVRDPEGSLQQASESALRHVVGSSELNQVLSSGRQIIAEDIRQRIQAYLDNYGAGIRVRQVNMQEGRPPEQVRAAFDDVIRAREDEERFKNEAQAYANRIIPEARGQSQRMLEEAEAYRAEVVAYAQGETRRFEQLLTEYQLAPKVTRERLYIDAMESVMSTASKVMVDVDGGNNMLYLPLDRMLQQSSSTNPAAQRSGAQTVTITPEAMRQISDNVARELGRGSQVNRLRREVR